jgi:hypothetical protein
VERHRRWRDHRRLYFQSRVGGKLDARRKTTVEPFNSHLKMLFEREDRVCHWGLNNNRSMVLGAIFACQALLTINHRHHKRNRCIKCIIDRLQFPDTLFANALSACHMLLFSGRLPSGVGLGHFDSPWESHSCGIGDARESALNASSMNNALAVYTPQSSLSGQKLAGVAREEGLAVRYLAGGGYIPGNADEIQKKALATVNGGALLIVGAFESDGEALARFDALIANGDRAAIAGLLNDGALPWCELYTGRFSYEKEIKKKPADKSKIDKSVARDQLAALKAARTRYIIYNQSRKKNGGQLMTRLAESLAAATGGVVADFQRPSR